MARLVIAAALICLSHWASATYSSGGGYGGGGYGGDYGYSGSGGYGGGAYHGPLAQPVVLANGFLADTKEVAAAKGAHYLALLSAKSSSGYGGGYGGGFGGGYGGGYGGGAGYNGGGAGYSGGGAGYSGGGGYGGGAYHGPLAQPVVLSSGYLADTKEVAAAKGAHYVALSEASARSGYGGGDGGYYGKQY